MKKTLLLMISGATALGAVAAVPDGYYNSLDGLRDANLKAAVKNLCYNHTILNYNNLSKTFEITDTRPGTNPAEWWDMYSNIPIYLPWSGKLLNREHAFPKSWWGGGTDTPAYTDINHLYPAEAAANMAKSNWPLGEVAGTPTFDNDWVLVGPPANGQGNGAAKVFEPNDEYKGDFARTYFYMVSVYSNLTWESKYSWMLQQNDYPTLDSWAVELLLRWHRGDPVSEKETLRNDAVYQVQGNRNPFIDNPQLCEYIWGNQKGNAFGVDVPVGGEATLISPSNDTWLDFNEAAIGSQSESKLYVKGVGLTENLKLTLAGTDASMFAIATTTLPYATVNSDEGAWVNVTYRPTAIGEHTALIYLSRGGMGGKSYQVNLRGQCLPVPELATLTATAATDVDGSGYTANWLEPAAGTAPDYYVVSRTRHVGSEEITEEIMAETNSVRVDNFEASDYDTYSVQSVALGYRSEPSNVIRVDRPTSIVDVDIDTTLSFIAAEGGFYVMIGRTASGARVYDATGRMVTSLGVVTDGMFVPLAPGVYVVVGDFGAPQKVIVP